MYDFVRRKSLWGLLIILALLLVVIRQTSLERTNPSFAEQAVRALFTPLQNGVNEVRKGISTVSENMASRKRLLAENRRLKEQLKAYQLQNQTLREYKYQSQRLKVLLGFKDRNIDTMELVGAEVIARSPSNWYNTVTINKGSTDGITKDMVVITPKGLVGRVTSTLPGTSTVLLVTDWEGAVGAMVQRNRTQGIVEGMGKGSLLNMKHIPYYSDIKKGDLVVTSNLSEIYPPGIPVGRVESVSVEARGLLKTASLIPAVDFDKLEEVFVVKRIIASSAQASQ